MGKIRVFSKSVRFTFRSKKRFFVFMLIFAIVSTYIAFIINDLDTLNTDKFLEQKGLVLEQFTTNSVSYNQSQALLNELLTSPDISTIENYASSQYIELDPSFFIYSIDVKNPWMSSIINPTFLQSGRFPNTANEIVIPAGSTQFKNSTDGIKIESDIVIGQTLSVVKEDVSIDLTVVGTIEPQNLNPAINPEKQLWMFLDQTKFIELLDLYGETIENTFTYSISVTVPGVILMKDTYDSIEQLNEEVKTIVIEENADIYGIWQGQPKSLPIPDAKINATNKLIALAFAVIGGSVLSIMFSYLISRFRRREIAVLKALGYSNSAVRTSLMGEIITTAFVGFVSGVGSAQALLLYATDFNINSLLRAQAILLSFIVNVVISLPGMFIASRRILKVSPAEAFRDK